MTSSAKKLASMVQELQWPLNLNCENNTKKKKMRVKAVSVKVICVLFVVSFLAGALLSSQAGIQQRKQHPLHCDHKRKLVEQEQEDPRDARGEVERSNTVIRPFENNMITLTSRLQAENHTLQKAFVVIGINTAFSSKRRRDSLRNTWMPKGEKLKKLEKEKGIVLRFVIGHSSTANGVLDKAIAAEDAKYKDFFRLNHIEGYHQLSTKTRLFFSTAITLWDAEFYVKVDDDVHVNLGVLVSNLAKHRSKPRIYIGCMKSGPVLSQKGVKYYEPEYWKFGEEGNKYFRHATGQIYAISKDLATYISINSDILHLFANEDVSLGSWFIGLEVEHVDDHSMCCGTPPECEFKLREGKVCASSFDWQCSGICRSVERMKQVHSACGEGDGAIWNVEL